MIKRRINFANRNLRVLAAVYLGLVPTRPATATVQCLRGSAPAVNVSNGTSPIWCDLNDGNGGGVQVAPNYTNASLGNSPSARAPAIISGVNPGPMNLPDNPSFVISNGDFFAEGEWNVDWSTQEIAFAVNYYACSGSGSEGELSLRYEWATNSWYLKVRGVDVLQVGVIGGGDGRVMTYMQGDVYRFQVWYKPSTGQCGVRLSVNGCWGRTTTGTTTGGALAPMTQWWWGSRLGVDGTQPFARFTEVTFHPSTVLPTAPPATGIMFGDSTGASYGNMICLATTYLSVAQRRNKLLQMISLAVPGHNAVQQLATYNASEYTTSATPIAWFLIRLGLNDIGSYTTAQWAANIRAIIAKVRADHPGATPIGSTLTPAYSFWVANYGQASADLFYAQWLEMNDAIKGIGPNAITEFAAVASGHSTTMLAPDGKSMAAGLSADGGHPKTTARLAYITPTETAAIHAAGFLLAA